MEDEAPNAPTKVTNPWQALVEAAADYAMCQDIVNSLEIELRDVEGELVKCRAEELAAKQSFEVELAALIG